MYNLVGHCFRQKDVSIHIASSVYDLRKPQPPPPSILDNSSSSSNRQNECVISLPVVRLRLSLHTVSSSPLYDGKDINGCRSHVGLKLVPVSGYLSTLWLKHTKYEESLCFVLYTVDVNAKNLHERRHRFLKVELKLSVINPATYSYC